MAAGPTHSKFIVQGLVSGKKHWFHACALRGDGQSPLERRVEEMVPYQLAFDLKMN